MRFSMKKQHLGKLAAHIHTGWVFLECFTQALFGMGQIPTRTQDCGIAHLCIGRIWINLDRTFDLIQRGLLLIIG